MSDLSDLEGVFPTPLRWSAENGVLGYGVYDASTGERDLAVIELGSSAAKFIMDFSCRERGYGLIRAGLYDMRLSPVGSSAPQWPGDDDFKPAVGFWCWNPAFGELRCESNAAIFRGAISGLWDQCRTFKEAAEGLEPVIFFTGRQTRLIKAIGKTFWAPTIDIVGWVPRDKVPPFASRGPTVKPPMAVDSQVRHALLDHLHREESKPPQAKLTAGDLIDDNLPDDPVDDVFGLPSINKKPDDPPFDVSAEPELEAEHLTPRQFADRIASEERRLGKAAVAGIKQKYAGSGRYSKDWPTIVANLRAIPTPQKG